MGNIPKKFEIYKHFKGRYYQIVEIAIHSETDEKYVVYRQLYEPYEVYVRPLEMFIEEVDRDKYPSVEQKMRFELVKNDIVEENKKEKVNEEVNEEVDPILSKFLKEDTYKGQISVISLNRNKLSEKTLMLMAFASDVTLSKKNIDEQCSELINSLEVRERYECVRRTSD